MGFAKKNALISKLQECRDLLMREDANSEEWTAQFYAINIAIDLAIDARFAFEADVPAFVKSLEIITAKREKEKK